MVSNVCDTVRVASSTSNQWHDLKIDHDFSPRLRQGEVHLLLLEKRDQSQSHEWASRNDHPYECYILPRPCPTILEVGASIPYQDHPRTFCNEWQRHGPFLTSVPLSTTQGAWSLWITAYGLSTESGHDGSTPLTLITAPSWAIFP